MHRGGAGIAFNLLTRKRPRPTAHPTSLGGRRRTLSDSAHEVVSEDGFSRLASHRRPPTPLPFSPLFSLSLPFPSSRREGTNRFHGSSHFPPLPRPKGGTERSAPASVADRATAQLFSVGDGVQLKRSCRFVPAQGYPFVCSCTRRRTDCCSRSEVQCRENSFQKEGRKGHNCTSARCT